MGCDDDEVVVEIFDSNSYIGYVVVDDWDWFEKNIIHNLGLMIVDMDTFRTDISNIVDFSLIENDIVRNIYDN